MQIVADFSPPRGADFVYLEQARHLDADFIFVNYSPGKSARVNSAFAAAFIKRSAGKEVIFSLSTRDMNRVATQGLLMGAEMMGLENVVALKGDPFSASELAITKSVDDYVPTSLIRAIAEMNRGVDYKGLEFSIPTSLCIGATIDLNEDIGRQTELTRKKVEAGAEFFLLQTLYSVERLQEFLNRYADRHGEELSAPISCGVQVLVENGITFGHLPDEVASSLRRGRSGEDIAVDAVNRWFEAGQRSIYLLAPIYPGGRRDYDSCQRVIERVRGL